MTSKPAKPSAPTNNIGSVFEDDSYESVPESPAHLDLQVSTSTQQCTVRWGQNHETNFQNCTVKIYIVLDFSGLLLLKYIPEDIKCLTDRAIRKETLPFTKLEYSLSTIPGEFYNAFIEVQNNNQKVVARGRCRFRACYSKYELQALYSKAEKHSGADMLEIKEVYRCKPTSYWQDIWDNHNGIMKPYMKDEVGHGENHINSTLKGLFFSAQLNKNGNEQKLSYFGVKKYSVTPRELFDPNEVNFYFCDFYFNANNPTKPFVTIVVCKKLSNRDEYCSSRLIPLPTLNPFFKVQVTSNNLTYLLNQNVSVELFYTENVQLKQDGFKCIKPLGSSLSLPKREYYSPMSLYDSKNDAPESVWEPLVQVDLKVTTSPTKCTVHWGHCGQNKFKNHYVQLYIFHRTDNRRSQVTKALFNERVEFSALEYSWDTDSGSSYVVQLEVKDPQDDRVVAIGKHQLRACFSKTDLEKLYKKAVYYCDKSEKKTGNLDGQLKLVGKLYRCKPQQYWQDILDFNDGMMEPCPLNDEIEHAENRTNNSLKGLLFSTEVYKGSTDFKYTLYPEEILHLYEVNHYFGDFYCTASNPRTHFVTIVVCKKQSPSDVFCTNNLHPLYMGNPFLKIGLTMSWYQMNKHVVTEFFYTEEFTAWPNRLKRIKANVPHPYCDKCTLKYGDFDHHGNVVAPYSNYFENDEESDSDLDNPFKEYISSGSEQSNKDQDDDDVH